MDRFVRLAPPLLLMGLIWYLSAQPDLGSDIDDLGIVVRKLGHMAIFGALFLAWWRNVPLPSAVAITFAWAVIDELHQTQTEGRHGTPVDVLIDTAGMALAYVGARGWRSWRTA